MWPQAEVSGAEALVQGQDAFLLRDPHDAVEEAAVVLALQGEEDRTS